MAIAYERSLQIGTGFAITISRNGERATTRKSGFTQSIQKPITTLKRRHAMLPSIWRNTGLMTTPNVEDFMQRFFYHWPVTTRDEEAVWTPRVDVHETDNEVLLDVELPGIEKNDVKVEVKDGVLTISGERKLERKGKEDGYRSVERRYGRYERSFGLGETVNAEKITASYKNGVMTITLPKVEKAKPREITVEVH
jgi:HSP20 family protein